MIFRMTESQAATRYLDLLKGCLTRMYEFTHLALTHLYPKLRPGGFLIVDDYGALANCRRPVEDFRHAHGITEAIVTVDWTGVYWRKR
jgi:O-methyltransferase